MARAKGYQGIVGLKKATVWGTAVACGALDGLEVHSANVVANRGIIARKGITGRVTQLTPDMGNVDVNGPITLPLRYEGAGRLIAGLFGTAGVPTTVDTTARTHVFKIADSTDGIFWTLAYEVLKDTLVYEFNTLKITGITLRWSTPGHVEIEVRTIGHNFSDASATNTTTTIDTITTPTYNEIAQARQAAGGVLMNAQSGGALGAGDAVYVTGGEITFERPLNAVFTSEFGDKSSEPEPPSGDDPFFKVTGSLTFANLQNGTGGNSAFVAEQIARTRKKMTILFTGDNLAGSATKKYEHKLFFPDVVFGEGKPTLAAGTLGWQAPFESHHVTAAPTGFTAGYVDACTWENTNQIATDVLA